MFCRKYFNLLPGAHLSTSGFSDGNTLFVFNSSCVWWRTCLKSHYWRFCISFVSDSHTFIQMQEHTEITTSCKNLQDGNMPRRRQTKQEWKIKPERNLELQIWNVFCEPNELNIIIPSDACPIASQNLYIRYIKPNQLQVGLKSRMLPFCWNPRAFWQVKGHNRVLMTMPTMINRYAWNQKEYLKFNVYK